MAPNIKIATEQIRSVDSSYMYLKEFHFVLLFCSSERDPRIRFVVLILFWNKRMENENNISIWLLHSRI